jgi:hypothetical protein
LEIEDQCAYVADICDEKSVVVAVVADALREPFIVDDVAPLPMPVKFACPSTFAAATPFVKALKISRAGRVYLSVGLE